MALVPKVENYCSLNNSGAKSVIVEGTERACINCIWYDPYYHENRGNVKGKVRTSLGWCILNKERRGALRQPCKDFELPESSTS